METCCLGDDKCISIWDLASNALLTELKGHEDTIMNVDWSLDGQYIASASIDGIVRLWPTQDFINTLNGYVYMYKCSFKISNCLCFMLYIFFRASSSAMSQSEAQIFSTSCSSILSLNYYKKNNSLICIGTA